jgi:DNA polymerase-1
MDNEPDIPDPDDYPAPENEHAEARGPAPEDTDGRGHDEVRAGIELVTFDLETGDADDLHRHGPGYVRLTGWATDDGPVKIQEHAAGVRDVGAALDYARTITGHNIMAFDLPALVREGVLTMPEVHRMAAEGRLFDGLLAGRHIDPPMARETGVDATRKYDLDSLGVKYELGEKSTAAKELAKKYGGWGAIPIDTESEDGQRFRDYAAQDVNLSRGLYRALRAEVFKQGPKSWTYLEREHRVAAIAAQIAYNGFRVDEVELERRLADIEQTKARALRYLVGKWGIPTTTADGRTQAKNPLGTKGGKERLEQALREAGATSIWHTESTGLIDVSADHMRHLYHEYAHLADVRRIAKAVHMIVGARAVYETTKKCLHPDGRVHPKIGFDQATGRWSLTQPGLTVFGKRNGRHVERMIFLPDPGEVILAVDLSQVDMRAVAALSQDEGYIRMLMSEDPHAEIARLLFGDPKMREVAKPIGHGWNYGRGIKAISESNDLDPALVRQFDRSMYERFPRLVEWQGEVRALAESGALLDNGFGRPMRPDPRRAHTQGPALMGQGAARDIMMTGMLRLPNEVLPMLRAQVHDEIVLSVPEKDAPAVARAVVEALSFEWRGVPILADVSPFGRTWGHVYEKGG